MKTGRGTGWVAWVLTSVVVLATGVAGRDQWINLRSANFSFVSSATEKDTRELATKLEQFHAIFTRMFRNANATNFPLTIVLFKGNSYYSDFRLGAGAEAYFLQGGVEPMIVMEFRGPISPMYVVHHEYTHALTQRVNGRWPLWLVEGVAQVYGSVECSESAMTLGTALRQQVDLLKRKRLIPLAEMFGFESGSCRTCETAVYFAESWALTHYLMFRSGESALDFGKFCQLIESGVEDQSAFQKAFRTDFKTVEVELREYVRQKEFPVARFEFQQLDYAKDITVEPLSWEEAQTYLGNVLVGQVRPRDADRYFKRVIAAGCDSPRLQAGLGLQALQLNKFGEATKYFRRALDGGMDNGAIRYFYAWALLLEATDGWKKEELVDTDCAKVIAAEAVASIKLMPSLGAPYDLLGQLCLAMRRDFTEGVKMAERAVVLARRDVWFRLNLARLQASLGQYDKAGATLNPLLNWESETQWKKDAVALKKQIDADARTGAPPAEAYRPPPVRIESRKR